MMIPPNLLGFSFPSNRIIDLDTNPRLLPNFHITHTNHRDDFLAIVRYLFIFFIRFSLNKWNFGRDPLFPSFFILPLFLFFFSFFRHSLLIIWIGRSLLWSLWILFQMHNYGSFWVLFVHLLCSFVHSIAFKHLFCWWPICFQWFLCYLTIVPPLCVL